MRTFPLVDSRDSRLEEIRLLLIDNRRRRRQQIAHHLRNAGIRVTVRGTGETGLKYLSRHRQDMLLCIMELPGRNGMAVLQAARALDPVLPVILVSENGTVSRAVQAIKQGASDFICWPVPPEQIIQTVRELLSESPKAELPPDPQLQKIKDLERTAFALGRANIDMLAIQEKLEEKNRQLEEALAELSKSRAMLHAVAEASPIPFIVSKRADGTILYANRPLAELVGLSPQELIGKKTPDFYVSAQDRQEVLSRLEKVGIVRGYESQIRRPDGTKAWMSFTLVNAEMDGEAVIVGGLYDIDQRHKMEEALRESEWRFRQLTENIAEIFWIYDARSQRTVYVSPAFESITGLSRQLVMDNFWNMMSIIHPEDRPRMMRAIQFSREHTGTYEEEYRIIKPDGEVRWLREKAFPVYDHAGELIRICGVSEDFTERKRGEAALRNSEEALRTVFHSVYDAIIVHDMNGRVLEVNDQMLTLFGISRETALQMKVPEQLSFSPGMTPGVPEIWQNVINGRPQFFEWTARRAGDNRLFDIEVYLQKITFRNQEAILGSIRDITERKKAQENLLLYRKIFQNANDPIAILDKAGKILEVNPAAVKMFGYPLEELRGKTIAVFIGEEIYAEMMQGTSDNAFSGIRKELSVLTKQGHTVVVELSGFPIYSEEGELIYRVGVARDITLRKQAQKALQEAHDELEIRVQERTAALEKANQELTVSEARNRALLDAIPDLMFRLNKEGVYTDYNAPKGSPLAVPSSEVIGKSVFETLPPELARGALEVIQRTIASAEPQVLEYELPHGDTVHYFEARTVKSGPDEVISIVRDITERKIAEEALKRARDELEMRVEERTAELAATNRELRETQTQLIQSEKMAALGTLVAGIAHEINTPVGAISSMHNTQVRAIEKLRQVLDRLCEGGLSAQPQVTAILRVLDDANRVIATGSERVTTIVRRLRSFARLDEAELKEADIHEGIEDTLVLLQHEIKHHVQVEKDFGDLPRISCYPGKLNQVLLNLLINARQAIKEEGTIFIKTWHENGRVFIRISDTGIGIPEHHLQRIFDPGFTTKGVGVGTGLGLSIVYRIVTEDHLGDIRVESTVGKGTTFTIILPDDLDKRVAHT